MYFWATAAITSPSKFSVCSVKSFSSVGGCANTFTASPPCFDLLGLISTNKGRVIRVAVKEIRTAGRNTQGVRIIKLSGEEKVVSAIKIDDNLI